MKHNKNAEQQAEPRSGVADYFAILGVGDQLLWKHTQKQSLEQEHSTDEEDDQQVELEDRFFREIIQVSIMAVEESAESVTSYAGSGTVASFDTVPHDALNIEQVASYRTDISQDPHPPLPNSPSYSEATTTANVSYNRADLSVLQERDGWCIVRKTLPASNKGFGFSPTDDTSAIAASNSNNNAPPVLWEKFHIWDANLEWSGGIRNAIVGVQAAMEKESNSKSHAHLTGLRRKFVESTFKHFTARKSLVPLKHKFFLAFQRRKDLDTPAVANLNMLYVRLHKSVLPRALIVSDVSNTGSNLRGLAGQILERYQSQAKHYEEDSDEKEKLVALEAYLTLPEGFEEWSIPAEYAYIRDPHARPALAPATPRNSQTVLLAPDELTQSSSSVGVEAIETESDSTTVEPELLLPRLMVDGAAESDDMPFCYIPVLAVRRQRLGDEERYHEDAAIVDLTVSFQDRNGSAVLPDQAIDDDDEEDEEEGTFRILGKTAWARAETSSSSRAPGRMRRNLGHPLVLFRKNIPFGFADAAFATRVLDRFPHRNYDGLPLPEEELPMFCYPTGCRLHRARFSDAPLAQYYGFVVKNERGDSIYVSCVSFMEPLTSEKENQLAGMSAKRSRTSLVHRRFCERKLKRKQNGFDVFHGGSRSFGSDVSTDADSNFLLTGFDDMTTFENKTICLVSRYPFWTAFRKFLSHLHILSGSTSDLPLERYISHLLLSVPLPRPGGPNLLIPLPALNDPMVLSLPPEKDFPLVDLPYHRLFACLEIKTVISIVLAMLALEKKVIVMSTRPSLVLDICELLRSLIFPFDLCAPYVPRLTEPFKSSLDFPGAIFVGIHDDCSSSGLAADVRKNLPEESIVIDLDTGEMQCSGDRYEFVSTTWDIIPQSARNVLVSELETLCRDAGIVDGQEPLDSQFDSAFDVTLASAVESLEINNVSREPLDDRAVRDAFLRFFCSVLGGYERFLVVPDADFLISGNEWFDAKGFLAAASSERSAYLNALVSTQLFQSFIQRRTEASDVHCLLFDECLVEYHSSPMPYGRLGGDVETVPSADSDQPQMVYSLLVDQCATLSHVNEASGIFTNRSMDASEADSSFNVSRASNAYFEMSVKFSESAVNPAGDIVLAPTALNLPEGRTYFYCYDGNPCFPKKLDPTLFLPNQPDSWIISMSKTTNPLLARSDRELEEATRRRRFATSRRGFQNQRRCLWQLPKLMGSHFLGAWLLCVPSQVSQSHLTYEQQSRYLLRALGAIRLLRSKQRIVPDEAAYRALMVACGRAKSDRRVELVKLFGLLRSDGIFPSAVTLGQYTRALAEGYSKRSSGAVQDEEAGGDASETNSRVSKYSMLSMSLRGSKDFEATISALDWNLSNLEHHGRRWRLRHNSDREPLGKADLEESRKKKSLKSWLPAVISSSFVAMSQEPLDFAKEIRFIAMWSRTQNCNNCGYIPLEEEVQAGWDMLNGDNEIPGAIACPRCGSLIIPKLGCREMAVDSAETPTTTSRDRESADFGQLPPHIGPSVNPESEAGVIYVTYISPATLRLRLEQYVEELGEESLERDSLRELDAEVFYNFWWCCARFSLPLPLPVNPAAQKKPYHYCAFAAWDRSAAERGCQSAAKALSPLLSDVGGYSTEELANLEAFDEQPLLSRYNLQGFYSTVWDHDDLSKILVTLVEACDKRDFKPVIESVLRSNQRRREQFGVGLIASDAASDVNAPTSLQAVSDAGSDSPPIELDVYKTILYLAKYQCTTAFHSFFPSTIKPCKGYHFWCAIGTPLPMFDRLFREGADRINNNRENQSVAAPIRGVSDVALGFRCVFGHLI